MDCIVSSPDDAIDFALCQRIYEEQSWKVHPVDDEYLGHVFLELATRYTYLPGEELAIAFDLQQLSFLHSKDFLKCMHDNALAVIERLFVIEHSFSDDSLCMSTFEWYKTQCYKMLDKLLSCI